MYICEYLITQLRSGTAYKPFGKMQFHSGDWLEFPAGFW